MIKILAIGNSFSQDAHRWLHTMAEYDGAQLETVNLYIGGCSLQMHWDNLRENLPAYDLERNGGPAEGKISIADALRMEKWDVVTLQQASPDCGFYESYQPYLRDLTATLPGAISRTATGMIACFSSRRPVCTRRSGYTRPSTQKLPSFGKSPKSPP